MKYWCLQHNYPISLRHPAHLSMPRMYSSLGLLLMSKVLRLSVTKF